MDNDVQEPGPFNLNGEWTIAEADGHIMELKAAISEYKRRHDTVRTELSAKLAERRRLDRQASRLFWKRLREA